MNICLRFGHKWSLWEKDKNKDKRWYKVCFRCRTKASKVNIRRMKIETNLKDYEDYVEYRWSPPELSADTAMMCYISTCMGGEAGEVLDAVKKYCKGKGSLDDVILEMGDTLYYLTALANHIEVSMDEILRKNKKKLDGRNSST